LFDTYEIDYRFLPDEVEGAFGGAVAIADHQEVGMLAVSRCRRPGRREMGYYERA
jgi:hypothetical protein